MSYDIYGNPLRRGHCEVHPRVHEEYPCSVCVAESRRQQEAQIPAQCDGNPAHCESAHYLGQAQEEIKRLNDEIQALRKDAERIRALAREFDRARRGSGDSYMPIWNALCESIGRDDDGDEMLTAVSDAMEQQHDP